jgi:electron transfer flavoprotein beta subunit
MPDTAATKKVAGTGGYKDRDVKFIANPCEEYGIEAAVQLVEKHWR